MKMVYIFDELDSHMLYCCHMQKKMNICLVNDVLVDHHMFDENHMNCLHMNYHIIDVIVDCENHMMNCRTNDDDLLEEVVFYMCDEIHMIHMIHMKAMIFS